MSNKNNSSIKQQAKLPKVGNNLSEGITVAEQLKEIQLLKLKLLQLKEIREELSKHKDAIQYLLTTNEHFQNEIKKEKLKKET